MAFSRPRPGFESRREHKGVSLNNSIIKLAASLILGVLLCYFLGGIFLTVAYTILWIDKIIIGSFGSTIRYFGIELTTFGTLIIASAVEPFSAFIIALVIIPFLHAMKYILLPLPEPEWPYFIPSPYNIIDAIGVLIAGLIIGLDLIYVVAIVILIKDILYAIVEKHLYRKPVDIISAIFYMIFNILLVYQFGWIIKLIS